MAYSTFTLRNRIAPLLIVLVKLSLTDIETVKYILNKDEEEDGVHWVIPISNWMYYEEK